MIAMTYRVTGIRSDHHFVYEISPPENGSSELNFIVLIWLKIECDALNILSFILIGFENTLKVKEHKKREDEFTSKNLTL